MHALLRRLPCSIFSDITTFGLADVGGLNAASRLGLNSTGSTLLTPKDSMTYGQT